MSDTDFIGHLAHVVVRWSDMDSYHHINNAKVVTILEEARVKLLHSNLDLASMVMRGLVVADLKVRYKAQLHHNDTPLAIEMWISLLRSSDFILEYRVRKAQDAPDAKPAVIASTRLVSFELTTQRIHRFDEHEIEILKKFYRPEE